MPSYPRGRLGRRWKKTLSPLLIAALLLTGQGFSFYAAAADVIGAPKPGPRLIFGAASPTVNPVSPLALLPTAIPGFGLNPGVSSANSFEEAPLMGPTALPSADILAHAADQQSEGPASESSLDQAAALTKGLSVPEKESNAFISLFRSFFDHGSKPTSDAAKAEAKPVYVMAPLTTVTDWNIFRKQLDVLRANGIAGITTDLWWGKFEREGDKRFDWSYYLKYADVVRQAGLQWVPILSFHQCGGNVGDDCNEPLPKWLWQSSADPDQEMKFIDEKGFVNGEHIAFWHEGAYRHYDEALASFAANFAPYADIIPKIQVSLGPAGELRYPSYNFAAGWSYPQRGQLQAYSTGAQDAFRDDMRKKYADIDRLNGAWGTALRSFDEIHPPKDTGRFFQSETRTAFGRDFLDWYQRILEGHLERMMVLAQKRLEPAFKARLGGKIAGVHWLYNSPTEPHSAENAAGYVDYDRLISKFKESGAELTFTALEMDERNPAAAPYSAPQTLVKEIATLAANKGVALEGENALAIANDESRYRNIRAALASHNFIGFTLLRLCQIVDSNGNPTPEMAAFVKHVVSPRVEHPGEKPPSPAFVPGMLWSPAWIIAHYGGLAAFFGWAANLTFLFFPWIQVAENFRNMRALKNGGEEAKKASERLAGVSAASQTALMAGNLLNLPAFLASGSAALIANALMGAAGSLAILSQLAASRHLSRGRWALLTASALAATLLTFLLPLPSFLIATATGLCATAIFSYFTVPQILKNGSELAIIREEGADSQMGRTAMNKLRGIKPRYLIVGMLGNLMLAPVFMVSGHWYNVVGNIIGIVGPLIVLSQLAKAGLFPGKSRTALAIGAAIFFVAMMEASFMAHTGFWS